MKIAMIATTAAAATALALAIPAAAQDYAERAEAAFQELVEGRVAGEPRSCINPQNSNRLRVVENVGLTYRQGDTLWVARVRDPRDLGPWDVPIIERYGSLLCRHDVIRTVDRNAGFFTGNVFLEDFVPWTKVDEG